MQTLSQIDEADIKNCDLNVVVKRKFTALCKLFWNNNEEESKDIDLIIIPKYIHVEKNPTKSSGSPNDPDDNPGNSIQNAYKDQENKR